MLQSHDLTLAINRSLDLLFNESFYEHNDSLTIFSQQVSVEYSHANGGPIYKKRVKMLMNKYNVIGLKLIGLSF